MRQTAYFFEPRLQGREAVVALVRTRWTPFLLRQAGFLAEPIHERASVDIEPDQHPNGHPFAWVYFQPAEAVLDEERLAGADSAAQLQRAIAQARRAAQSAPCQEADLAPGDAPASFPLAA